MRIVDLLTEERVAVPLSSRDKDGALRELAERLSRGVPGLDGETLYRALREREELATTGIGDGVAIPHTKVHGVEGIMMAVGLSRAGIDFASIDEKPAHIFVALIAPEHSTGDHLKALARISRLCRDAAFRGKLLAAQTPRDACEIIAQEDARH